MILELKEKDQIQTNEERESWLSDPLVQQYVELRDVGSVRNDEDNGLLTNFNRYYEIYNNDHHVGDIKVFYETEDDIFYKRAQILMVVGDRNKGIGTEALNILMDKMKDIYQSAYCVIQKSNIASLKILKRNNFHVDKMDGQTIQLSREF